MPVAALTLAGLSRYTSASSTVTASQKALQSLQSAVNSGNLRTAQNALTRYQTLTRSQSSGTTGENTQLTAGLTTLSQAIGSGDVSAAQSALAAVQGSLQANPASALAAAQAGSARALSQVQGVLSALGTSSSSSSRLSLYA